MLCDAVFFCLVGFWCSFFSVVGFVSASQACTVLPTQIEFLLTQLIPRY